MRPALTLLGLFTLLTGFVYPAALAGIGEAFFPVEARGDASLIGRSFTEPREFHSRPSANGYDASASSGSNLGPTNPKLLEAIAARTSSNANAPVDLLTASGSGLDPHISPEAAIYQAERVARARAMPVEEVRALVEAHTEGRTFGLLGEPRVNVQQLNLALDRRQLSLPR